MVGDGCFVPTFGFPDRRKGPAGTSRAVRAYITVASVTATDDGRDENGGDAPVTTAIGRLERSEIAEEMSKSYMEFAMSVILGRALPDIRDGLKPVHRRILYAMHEMNVNPTGPFRKSARVVGEVLGKYHPHGDSSVYDALVRMAQPFSMNLPLIDGHGNFGSVDGDAPAAMRYTECRLSKLSSEALLKDLESDTVDFVPTFDSSGEEPLVVPARVPNLLITGSQGIAVGLATKIPPFNLREVIEATLLLLRDPAAHDAELLQVLPAPDFPTGGEIFGLEGPHELFKTGKGRITVRAKTHFEKVPTRGGKSREAIVVTELPYQVNKANLVKAIADLVNQKQLEGIVDLRDESDRDGMRIVIETNRQAYVAVVLNNLFKRTALQSTFAAQIVALDGGKLPGRFSVRACLERFIEFRKDVIRRRCEFELRRAQERFHIIDGYLVVLENLDNTIEVIKASSSTKDAKTALMERIDEFQLSAEQADAVLNLQLRRLTRMEKGTLEKEHAELTETIQGLKEALADPRKVVDIISSELKQILKTLGKNYGRKSLILTDGSDISDTELIPNGRSVVLITDQGYVKRMPIEQFNVQNRGGRGLTGVGNLRAKDRVAHFFTCRDHDKVMVITKSAIVYELLAYKIPVVARTSRGTPIAKLIPSIGTSPVAEVLHIKGDDKYLLTVTKKGIVKKSPLSILSKVGPSGSVAMSIREGDELKAARICNAEDSVFLCSKFGKALHAKLSDEQFPVRKGKRSIGVIGMRFRPESFDEIVDVTIIPKGAADKVVLLVVLSHGVGKRIQASEIAQQRRGCRGITITRLKKKEEVVAARPCEDDDQFMLITSQGQVVRVRANSIKLLKQYARGVIMQQAAGGNRVIAVDLINKRIMEEGGETISFINDDVESIEEVTPLGDDDGVDDAANDEDEDDEDDEGDEGDEIDEVDEAEPNVRSA